VIVSLASSSGEDAPRGIDFLMSRNRLNVAVSRAQCLAYLVCAPRLLDVSAKTVGHMRLANALCRFVELAKVD
jgi:superfamily I DNA and/or RNA helicase